MEQLALVRRLQPGFEEHFGLLAGLLGFLILAVWGAAKFMWRLLPVLTKKDVKRLQVGPVGCGLGWLGVGGWGLGRSWGGSAARPALPTTCATPCARPGPDRLPLPPASAARAAGVQAAGGADQGAGEGPV
jgi:hypothetical protein